MGKAINLKARVSSYWQQQNSHSPKTRVLASEISNIDHITVESEIEALLLESALIKRHQPKYNIVAKDDKSFIYIKIDKSGALPIITTSRREKSNRKIILFGPFPSASTTRYVLKTLRHTFPYCSHARNPRSCLWVHLGLCPGPWQNLISYENYQNQINRIILFLKNKNKRLIKNLEKDMVKSAKEENFEKAGQVRDQIAKLQYVLTKSRPPQQYIDEPDLLNKRAKSQMYSLKKVLKLKKIPKRIECYDISNIQGKHATGSMVVFINGQKDTSQYRRFAIRTKNTPDDFSMMKEVLTRRFGNSWPKPDLIVIDGGKGQLSAVFGILESLLLDIPLIGLAKRLEEIYRIQRDKITQVKSFAGPIRLGRDHPALQLVQAARDEAHRFAITYHRKIRSKATLG